VSIPERAVVGAASQVLGLAGTTLRASLDHEEGRKIADPWQVLEPMLSAIEDVAPELAAAIEEECERLVPDIQGPPHLRLKLLRSRAVLEVHDRSASPVRVSLRAL